MHKIIKASPNRRFFNKIDRTFIKKKNCLILDIRAMLQSQKQSHQNGLDPKTYGKLKGNTTEVAPTFKRKAHFETWALGKWQSNEMKT